MRITFIGALAAFGTAVANAQVPPILIEHNVTINGDGIPSDRFTWQDSQSHPRVAVLAHNDGAAGPNGSYGGAMREFRYQMPDNSTRVANVTNYGNSGYSGFGYVVEHSHAGNCVADDSPLGFQFPGTWMRIFEGRHHVIFRFQQNYPRNCPNMTRYIPVTYDWIFSTGRDNPVYAITYDVASVAAADVLNDDSRAPYGELNIDGDGSTNIDGTAWGDRYKFTSTNAPVSLSSSWTYNIANTVPYVKEWIVSTDATMGIVQTQTMDQQDAGGARQRDFHDITLLWNKTSASIPGNGYCGPYPSYSMPCQDEWAYQANADSININFPNNNARLTWRTQWGFIGQTTYDANDGTGAFPPGYPKKSYSTYIVLGTHSSGPVEAQVTQVETVQSVTLSTVNGSVITTGPAGVSRIDNVTYAPAGYNHVYGALAFNANANQLDANIAVGSGTLKKPLIIVSNYTGTFPPTVTLNGTPLTSDVGFFGSIRTSASELWITLNADLAGATNHLQIASSGPPPSPTGVSTRAITSTRIDLTWNAVAGATYQIDRESSLAGGFVQIATPPTNSYSDTGLAAGTAYVYRVRAVTAGGTSANSAPHVSTTVVYTDNPVAFGIVVKATHLAELRSAVTAVRTLAAVGAVGFTDAATAGTLISAIHITELRSDLDPALTALGIATSPYTDNALAGVAVKAVHFQELRDRMQ